MSQTETVPGHTNTAGSQTLLRAATQGRQLHITYILPCQLFVSLYNVLSIVFSSPEHEVLSELL